MKRVLGLAVGWWLVVVAAFSSFADANEVGVAKHYRLYDDKPAPLDLKGWEHHSFPLGNGYFGVSFFGGIQEELWQFTEKSVCVADPAKAASAWDRVGLSSLCELRLLEVHDPARVSHYRRELDLEKAMGTVSFEDGGTTYTREALVSYPDRCFAARLSASETGKISFRLAARQACLNASRTGTSTMEGNTIVLRGTTLPYRLKYEVRISVQTKGGTIHGAADGTNGELSVEGADEAVVWVTLGTNYRLDPQVFLTGQADRKLAGMEVPSAELDRELTAAMTAGWAAIKARHQADVGRLFGRAAIDLGGADPGIPTDQLLTATNLTNPAARYLEELYFQYGRYLLIASSRKGTLPANLQGTWNMQTNAPWTGGIWANINIQMNYWPAFSTGLEETFEPYYDFFHAEFRAQQGTAWYTLKTWTGKNVTNGWTAGTANTPYWGSGPGDTSGAGTGPFVILPMWDWYAFTGDTNVLEKIWPFLLSSSRFLTAALKEQPDGTLLCDPSWSPENQKANGPHIRLPGTAYDQQLVYENHRLTLRVAELLHKSDPILAVVAEQLPKLSPVLVGASGQIKEFRQENAYGEFGDPHHRHISQLIGLCPGTVIAEKQEWLDAARVTLNLRGDRSTGWAMAFRLNLWARVKDGNRAHRLLQTLLQKGTMANLWDTHPPFQIDGNFGGAAGMAEMLLQSHEGFIDLLPALPDEWKDGSFSGLRARGAFSVSASWKNQQPTRVTVWSEAGNDCRVRGGRVGGWRVVDSDGAAVPADFDQSTGMLSFKTVRQTRYELIPAGQ